MAGNSRFYAWRTRRGLTQVQVAGIVGCDQRTISGWDRGVIPHPAKREEFARRLGARVRDLFDLTGKRKAA